MLPWTAPSTLPRSGSHGVLAHQQRGLAGHRGGGGLVQLSSTCLPALSATATWQASRLQTPFSILTLYDSRFAGQRRVSGSRWVGVCLSAGKQCEVRSDMPSDGG